MPQTDLTCACGQVHLRVTGDPFVACTCYCTSCRTASERLSALPVTPPMADATGGTAFRLYRKDRVDHRGGGAHLAAFHLTDGAPTRRVIATCCNTPMFLEFQGGHWLSLYNGIFPDAASFRPSLLTQTADAPDPGRLPAGVPRGAMTTARFYGKLLGAWIAMGFRAPKIDIPGKVAL